MMSKLWAMIPWVIWQNISTGLSSLWYTLVGAPITHLERRRRSHAINEYVSSEQQAQWTPECYACQRLRSQRASIAMVLAQLPIAPGVRIEYNGCVGAAIERT